MSSLLKNECGYSMLQLFEKLYVAGASTLRRSFAPELGRGDQIQSHISCSRTRSRSRNASTTDTSDRWGPFREFSLLLTRHLPDVLGLIKSAACKSKE
jgi:hypothetical protein